MKAYLVLASLVAFLAAVTSAAQDSRFSPKGQQIPVPDCLNMRGQWEGGYTPCTAADHEAWLNDITHWRMERRIRVGFNSARYTIPELLWTQSSFVQPQMMVQDRYFYDPVAGTYTVDRYLEDLRKRYGGIDAVLIWPEDGISDALLEKFKQQLGPEFFYIDCKMDGTDNAGLFVRQSKLTVASAYPVHPL